MGSSNFYAIAFGMLCLPAIAAEKLPAAAPAPQTATDAAYYSDTLFGDWKGKRSAMLASGYDLQVNYKLDLLNNTSINPGQIYGLDYLGIMLNVDLEKAAHSKGTSAFLHVISNHGDDPGAHSNRLPHGLDNIEVPANGNTTKLFQAWLQRTFLDEKLSVLAGLYDLNSEFYYTETAAMFTHPTFGIGAEFAGTGKNGPSVFPTSSFGIRVKAEPVPGYYLQAITLDGVPGDPNNPKCTCIKFDGGDGALNVIEGGIPLGPAANAHNNKLAFGIWQYTTRFDDILDTDAGGNPVQRVSHGAYAMVEKVLKYRAGSGSESISGFFRIGQTEGDTTQFDLALSAGLVFKGAIPGRAQDELGIAYAQEHNGEKYRISSGNTVHFEKSYELSYRYRARAGLVIQPIIQYLQNHSEDTSQDRTWWLGLRMDAAL